VRFGRALGYGARHAAKSLAQAVDAATTPSPPSSGGVRRVPARPSARPSVAQVTQHAKVAGKSAWAPLARFSSVLWLQVTGSFFALITVVLGQALWLRRGVLGQGFGSHEAQKLYGLTAVFLLFAYFALSNFVRAARRDRR
jgi:hypothetical protein